MKLPEVHAVLITGAACTRLPGDRVGGTTMNRNKQKGTASETAVSAIPQTRQSESTDIRHVPLFRQPTNGPE